MFINFLMILIGIVIGAIFGAIATLYLFIRYIHNPKITELNEDKEKTDNLLEKAKVYCQNMENIQAQEKERQRAAHTQRKCAYLIRDSYGEYICEINGSRAIEACPQDKNAICLTWAKVVGKVPCQGYYNEPCQNGNIMLFNDYQVSLQTKGYEGLCWQCAIAKRELYDKPNSKLGG